MAVNKTLLGVVTTASSGGLATLAVAAGLVLVSGVTTGLLDGLLSDCAVVTVALLPVTVSLVVLMASLE